MVREKPGGEEGPRKSIWIWGDLGDGDWRLSLEKQRVIVHGVRGLAPGSGVREGPNGSLEGQGVGGIVGRVDRVN